MKLTGIWIIVFSLILGNGYAKTITVSTGWRAPLSGDSLPEQGSHSKLVRMVFRHMGHDLQLNFMAWKRVYEITKAGDVVASFSWARTPQREKEVLFPDNPLSTSVEVGFYKHSRFPDGLDVVNLEALKNQELGIVGVSSYWYESLFDQMGIQAHMVPFSPLAWRMLDAGRVDIFIENQSVGVFEVQKTLGIGKHLEYGTTVPLKQQNLYLIFSRNHKDSINLLRLFDKTVFKLKTDGLWPKQISN